MWKTEKESKWRIILHFVVFLFFLIRHGFLNFLIPRSKMINEFVLSLMEKRKWTSP